MAGAGPEGALHVFAVKFRRRHAGMKQFVPPRALCEPALPSASPCQQYRFIWRVPVSKFLTLHNKALSHIAA